MKLLTALTGKWNVQKSKLKKKFTMLSEKEVLFIEGNQEKSENRLRGRFDSTKEQIDKILTEL